MNNSITIIALLACPLYVLAADPDSHESKREPASQISRTFDCLRNVIETKRVLGTYDKKLQLPPGKNKGFDARGARFIIKDAKWGMVDILGNKEDTDMCWVGGYFESDKPWDASWSQHKDVESGGGGKTRNSSVITIRAPNATISGIHFFNVHDGPRTTDTPNWRVEHVWGEYVRDDAIENDGQYSGVLYDSLLDGCFVGISTRAEDAKSDATNNTVVLDRVLLRLTPQPYGYKWDTRGFNYKEGKVPMGQGLIFKVNDPSRTPRFIVKNSIFCLHFDSTGNGELIDFPESIIKECFNNTIVWLGDGKFRGEYDPKGFVLTRDKSVWKTAVIDWHARHPEVGKHRKPPIAQMGDMTILKKF